MSERALPRWTRSLALGRDHITARVSQDYNTGSPGLRRALINSIIKILQGLRE